MTTDEIRTLLLNSYESFNRGDRFFAFKLFHDDIEWIFNHPPEALPFPNRVKGKLAVLTALKRVDDVVETISTNPETVIVEGDCAVAICDITLRQRTTGRIMRYKCAALHRYRDGKLIEYTAFADGFDILQQALGREIDVPAVYPA